LRQYSGAKVLHRARTAARSSGYRSVLLEAMKSRLKNKGLAPRQPFGYRLI
jgi:hypothetical protein